MQYFGNRYKNKKQLYSLLILFLATTICLNFYLAVNAQSCPPNIDFEKGTFEGWICYTGYSIAIGDSNSIQLTPSNGPVIGHHAIFTAGTHDQDIYGHFPVNCPNGSGHSIKLGSSLTSGGSAEGISYEFTIPANENTYSFVYNYAVVLQAPHHKKNEQPRMEIEVYNVTDDSVISCGSVTYIAIGSSLPGFQTSGVFIHPDTTAVLYKPWTAASVNLSGNAGKTIRVFFKSGDCVFERHFGYAYIDVNSDCSGNLPGTTYCADDSVISVTAPDGYANYIWYNDSTLTTVLDSMQIIRLKPPPVAGSVLAIKLDPYRGYGCSNIYYANFKNTLVVQANAGRDTSACNQAPVQIGAISKQGLVYTWKPLAGLDDPEIGDPIATPDKTTPYILTTRTIGGGCITSDTVIVTASIIDSTIKVVGKPSFCIGNGDSAVLNIQPVQNMQWFKDDILISGARGPTYHVTEGGVYYAMLMNDEGCKRFSQKQVIAIENAAQGVTYAPVYAIINSPLVLNARPIGASILWNPSTSLDNPESFTPKFNGASDKLYTIEITTNAGCITGDTQLVKTVKSIEVFVPGAFSPNNDGINDYLRPILKGVKKIGYFRIYNRAGMVLFETKANIPGWDGTFKGMPQGVQTVVWVLECVGVDGVVYLKKGTAVLLR